MQHELGRVLVILGVVTVIVGLLLWLPSQSSWLGKLGHLPGDIFIDKKNVKIYIPLATSLLISLVLSLIFWLFNK